MRIISNFSDDSIITDVTITEIGTNEEIDALVAVLPKSAGAKVIRWRDSNRACLDIVAKFSDGKNRAGAKRVLSALDALESNGVECDLRTHGGSIATIADLRVVLAN